MTDRAPVPEGRASFQRANDESRERMARLFATLTPAQMAIDLGGGWTVASVVAHTGFWDRWQVARWQETLAGEWSADAETPVESILAERPALLDRSIHRLEHLAAIDLALTHGC